MRIRRLISVGWVLVFAIASVVPAYAKGAHQVTLTADGRQVTFSGEGEPNTNTTLSNFAGSVRLFDSISEGGRRVAEPIGDLGPQVTAEWMFMGPIGDIPLVQVLYPFAADGPIGHIPAGQMLWDEEVEEAWFPLADDFSEAFLSIGFDLSLLDPATSVSIGFDLFLLDPATSQREQAASFTESPWSPLWLFGLLIALGTGAVGARSGIMRRRNQRMA